MSSAVLMALGLLVQPIAPSSDMDAAAQCGWVLYDAMLRSEGETRSSWATARDAWAGELSIRAEASGEAPEGVQSIVDAALAKLQQASVENANVVSELADWCAANQP